MSWGITKKYVTIVRVENPNGAVTVNEQYLPSGTCRRYERGKLNGSVTYASIDKESVDKDLKDFARVKNMFCEVNVYKLKGKYKETDMMRHDLLESWEYKGGYRCDMIALKQGISKVWKLVDNEWELVHSKPIE